MEQLDRRHWPSGLYDNRKSNRIHSAPLSKMGWKNSVGATKVNGDTWRPSGRQNARIPQETQAWTERRGDPLEAIKHEFHRKITGERKHAAPLWRPECMNSCGKARVNGDTPALFWRPEEGRVNAENLGGQKIDQKHSDFLYPCPLTFFWGLRMRVLM